MYSFSHTARADVSHMPNKPPSHRPKKRTTKATDARPSACARGYDARWRKLRLIVLNEEPLCRICRENGRVVAAHHVDHITPLVNGGTHDRDNLQPLCVACHNRKTKADNAVQG